MQIDSTQDWVAIYRAAGLQNIKTRTGPFEMMTPRGFLKDEGMANSLAVMCRGLSRWSYLQKMAWLMPRMQRAVPYLGYVVVAGDTPS